MTLQGDLNSFALPDVLRLLAATGKSGRLEVSGSTATGEVVLRDGAIAEGHVTSAPHAADASDLVFELLRFDGGAFAFVEGEQEGDGATTDVEEAIGRAEVLVAEWAEVETVVPSMDAWLSLAPEVDDDHIELTGEQWRAIAAIAGGGNVRDLASVLEATDLVASRQAKELVERGLVALRPTHAYEAPRVELDSFEEFELDGIDPMTELEDLVVEDRPVVMEDRDDALLPEPLPGEGVAYEGEVVARTVDRHAFDHADAAGAEELEDAGVEGDDAYAAFAGAGDVAPFPERAGSEGSDSETSDEVGDDALAEELITSWASDDESADDEVDEDAPVPAAELPAPDAEPDAEVAEAEVEEAPAPAPEAEASGDEERGSLLRFLSTVKP